MVAEHYANILTRSQDAFRQMSEEQDLYRKFIAAHNDAGELDCLAKLISDRPEAQMYKLARLEFQHALYSVAFAQYRQAHVSLRLFLELSLSAVLFSGHEIDAHLWMKGRKDSNWGSVISNETGIFSKQFVGAFFEEMKEFSAEYLAMASKLYRECSEFVHGNRSSFDGIDTEIAFNQDIIESWLDRAETASLLVKFAFLTRYLPHVSSDTRGELEQMALEQFGKLEPIQAIYAGATL